MLLTENNLYVRLKTSTKHFHPVVKFDPEKEKLVSFDFTVNNTDLQKIDLSDTEIFGNYISGILKQTHAKFGMGGYNELRTVYTRSVLFDDDLNRQSPAEEPRRLHLGIDIWGDAGTEVFVPWGGMVHSFAFNNNFGDYGATIVLLHQLEGLPFFTLYGHVSLVDIQNIREGAYVSRGQKIAHFGTPEENGHWPPHLHFQVIQDITPYKGDYPGVCKFSERKKYLLNCPDPDLVLNMQKFIPG
ncbi:MAG: peptidoglycan DD-metalloendopeptidase family protein [Ginsengibacter sp.]